MKKVIWILPALVMLSILLITPVYAAKPVTKVTGGGWTQYEYNGVKKVTFGITAANDADNNTKGQFQANFHNLSLGVLMWTVHSTNMNITAVVNSPGPSDGRTAWIEGNCTIKVHRFPNGQVLVPPQKFNGSYWVLLTDNRPRYDPDRRDNIKIILWIDEDGDGIMDEIFYDHHGKFTPDPLRGGQVVIQGEDYGEQPPPLILD